MAADQGLMTSVTSMSVRRRIALTVVAVLPVWLAQRFGGDQASTRV
ncbi:hypothetical protein [Mycobacterium sp. 1274761.0]|nr:hypothetical protein [Mycobacterium sp. 1274761.0]